MNECDLKVSLKNKKANYGNKFILANIWENLDYNYHYSVIFRTSNESVLIFKCVGMWFSDKIRLLHTITSF